MQDRRHAPAGPPPSGIERRRGADRRVLQQRRVRLAPGLQQGWLVFQCGDERRRLVPVPTGWDELSSAELAELCRRAPLVATPGSRGASAS